MAAKPKILITGAGGMLGTDLLAALRNDFDVVGLDKKPAPHISDPLEICDLTQERKAHETILSQKPDFVFHCAALTDVDYCELHHDEALLYNVEATKNVVLTCNELDVPLFFYSTDYIFDGDKKGGYVETDPPAPKSFYGKSKLLAEEFILQNAKRALIFRISWLFGVYGRSFPNAILRQARETKKLSVVAVQVGHPTYTKDVASAMAQILRTKRDEVLAPGVKVYHLVNSGKTNWADLARFLLKQSNCLDVKVEDITSDQLKRPAPRPSNSDLLTQKIKAALGVQLRVWQEAVKEFLIEAEEVRKMREAKAQAKTEAEETSS